MQGVHILNNVDIVKGSVITQRNTIDYTQYTAYMLLKEKEYVYKIYDDQTLIRHNLNTFDLEGSSVILK